MYKLFDDNSSYSVYGSMEVVPHLSKDSIKRMKTWALRTKLSQVEVVPQVLPFIDFDFSGVCANENEG